MNFSLNSRLVRPRAEEKQREKKRTNELVCRSRLTVFLQQGAAEAASRVRERVSASFGCRHQSPCMFHLRVHVSKGVFGGVGFRGAGGRKCTLVELLLRGEVSECVWFESKSRSKLINSIRNESQQVVHVCGVVLETHCHRCRQIHQPTPQVIVLISHISLLRARENIFCTRKIVFSTRES